MSGQLWGALAGVAFLLGALALYALVRRARLRFEVYYDRPQGEPEVFRFVVWLPPFFRLQWVSRPTEEGPEVRSQREPDWREAAAKGRTAIRELRVVERTLVSLFRHELAFLEAGASPKRGLRFGLRLLEQVPWEAKELSWVTRVGAGDAALTGMVCGLLWAFKGTAFGVLAERMTFARRPVVRVLPDFQAVAFRTTFRCIVEARLGDIIRTGAGMLRRKRGAAWKTNTRLRA